MNKKCPVCGGPSYINPFACINNNCQSYNRITDSVWQAREQALKEVKEPLKIILDFVERWNKQDSEKGVAEAAENIKKIVKI